MRKRPEAWVVYKMTITGAPGGNAVCEQGEWDAMEKSNPGFHTLVQGGINSEEEAEKIARGIAEDERRERHRKTI